MKNRKLTSSIETSVIGFGGGAVAGRSGGYGYGDLSEADAVATLRHSFERGII